MAAKIFASKFKLTSYFVLQNSEKMQPFCLPCLFEYYWHVAVIFLQLSTDNKKPQAKKSKLT